MAIRYLDEPGAPKVATGIRYLDETEERTTDDGRRTPDQIRPPESYIEDQAGRRVVPERTTDDGRRTTDRPSESYIERGGMRITPGRPTSFIAQPATGRAVYFEPGEEGKARTRMGVVPGFGGGQTYPTDQTDRRPPEPMQPFEAPPERAAEMIGLPPRRTTDDRRRTTDQIGPPSVAVAAMEGRPSAGPTLRAPYTEEERRLQAMGEKPLAGRAQEYAEGGGFLRQAIEKPFLGMFGRTLAGKIGRNLANRAELALHPERYYSLITGQRKAPTNVEIKNAALNTGMLSSGSPLLNALAQDLPGFVAGGDAIIASVPWIGLPLMNLQHQLLDNDLAVQEGKAPQWDMKSVGESAVMGLAFRLPLPKFLAQGEGGMTQRLAQQFGGAGLRAMEMSAAQAAMGRKPTYESFLNNFVLMAGLRFAESVQQVTAGRAVSKLVANGLDKQAANAWVNAAMQGDARAEGMVRKYIKDKELAKAMGDAANFTREWRARNTAAQEAETIRQKDLAIRARAGDKAAQAELAAARGIGGQTTDDGRRTTAGAEARRAEGLVPEVRGQRSEVGGQPELRPEGGQYAVTQGKIAEGGVGEYPGAGAERAAAEAGGGDRVGPGGVIQEEVRGQRPEVRPEAVPSGRRGAEIGAVAVEGAPAAPGAEIGKVVPAPAPMTDTRKMSFDEFHDWLIFDSPEAKIHYQAIDAMRYVPQAVDNYVKRIRERYEAELPGAAGPEAEPAAPAAPPEPDADLMRQWYIRASSYKNMVVKKATQEQAAGKPYRPEVDIEAFDAEAERIIATENRVPELAEVIANVRGAVAAPGVAEAAMPGKPEVAPAITAPVAAIEPVTPVIKPPAKAPAAAAPTIPAIEASKGFAKAQPLIQMAGKVISKKAILPILQSMSVKGGVARMANRDLTVVRMKSVLKDGLYTKVGNEFVRSPMDASEFPPEPVLTGKRDLIRFPDGPAFLDSLKKVSTAESIDEQRAVLNGTLLEVGEGGFWMVATDGRRLTCRFVPGNTGGLKVGAQVVLPRNIREIMEADDKAPAWQMNVEKPDDRRQTTDDRPNIVRVENGNMEITGKLVEGTYPNFKQVIPAQADVSWVVDKKQVLDALKQIKPFWKGNKRPAIKLRIEPGVAGAAMLGAPGVAGAAMPGAGAKLIVENIEPEDRQEYRKRIELPVEVGGLMKPADDMTVLMPLRTEPGYIPKKGEEEAPPPVVESIIFNPEFFADALETVGEGRVKIGVGAGAEMNLTPAIIQGATAVGRTPEAGRQTPALTGTTEPAEAVKPGKRAGKRMAAPEEDLFIAGEGAERTLEDMEIRKGQYAEQRGETGPFHDIWNVFDKRTGEKLNGVYYTSEAAARSFMRSLAGKRAGARMAAPEEEVRMPAEAEAAAIAEGEAARPPAGPPPEPVAAGLTGTGKEYGQAAAKLPPEDDPGYSVFPIELPELVQLAKTLTGKYPVVKRGGMRGAVGLYHGGGKPGTGQQIDILASLYDRVTKFEKAQKLMELSEAVEGPLSDPAVKAQIKAEYEAWLERTREERKDMPPVFALKTLAHEIGHAADFEPLEDVKGRGNIFAHVGSLAKYMKKSFPRKPGDDEGLPPAARRELRNEAAKAARAELGTKPDPKALAAKTSELYAEMVREKMGEEGLATYDEMMAELKPMIAWWHGAETIPEYYASDPSEMYAEALSVLLNNPAATQKRAPAFYSMFYAYMQRKPEFKAAYEKVMDMIGTSALYDERGRILTAEMKQANKDVQAWADLQKARTWRERKDLVRRQLDRQLGPLQQRVVKVTDEGLKWGALSGMDRFLYRQTMQWGADLRMRNEVLAPLLEAGKDIMALDEFLFHKRVVEFQPAAGDVAQPWGFERHSSGQMLAEMQRRDPAGYAVLEQADAARWKVYKEEALDRLRRYGIFTEEMIDELEQPSYATWQVSRKGTPPEDPLKAMMESRYGPGITSHIYKQFGTHMPVASPYVATANKMFRLISLAERENMKFNTLAALTSEKSPWKGEWAPAKMVWTGKRREIQVVDNERIGTLTVLHDGKLTGWYGPKVLVDALSFGNPNEMGMIADGLSVMLNAEKSILTRFNPTFVPKNWRRDIRAFNQHMPGTSRDWRNWVPFAGGAYGRFSRPAFKAAASLYTGMPNPIAQDALRRGVPIAAHKGYMAMADKAGEMIVPDISDRGAVKRFLSASGNAGQILEAMSKINAMLYMDWRFPEMREGMKMTAVHTWGGSPNFLERMDAGRLLEWVRMFPGPFKEGWRATSWAWFGGGGWQGRPWEQGLNLFRRSILPMIGIYMVFGGGLSRLMEALGMKRKGLAPDWEQQYADGPSEFDKARNFNLPVGYYDKAQHKVMYVTLPLAESERNIMLMIKMGLDAIIGKVSGDPRKDERMSELAQFMAGDLPGINPITGMIGNWLMYASGGTPYDTFRMRKALTKDQEELRGLEGLKAMAWFTANQLGSSLIGAVKPETTDDLPRDTLEKIIYRMPGLRGFIKISDAGFKERFRKSTQNVEQQQAQIRVDIEKIVLRLRHNGRLTPEEYAKITDGYAVDKQAGQMILPPEDELRRYYFTHFDYAMKEAKIPYQTPEARTFLRQPSRAAKAAVIQELMRTAPPPGR